jgi:hypothetical protein
VENKLGAIKTDFINETVSIFYGNSPSGFFDLFLEQIFRFYWFDDLDMGFLIFASSSPMLGLATGILNQFLLSDFWIGK